VGLGYASLKVELNLPTAGWTDITSYIRHEDGVTIDHGLKDEAGQAGPNILRFRVNNSDGRFSPTYIAGAWYGQIARNVPIRGTVEHANASSSTFKQRFTGTLDSLPLRWDQSANDKSVEITASSQMRRLQKSSTSISALKAFILSANPYGSTYPKTYWAMEGATTAGPKYSATVGLSGTAGQLVPAGTGTITPDNYDGFEGSGKLPTFGANCYMVGRMVPYLATGTAPHVVRMAIKLPAAGTLTDGWTLLNMSTNMGGTVANVGINYRTAGGGGLSFYAKNYSGTDLVGDSAHGWSMDGKRCVIYFTAVNTSGSSTLTWTLGARVYSDYGVETVNSTNSTTASALMGTAWMLWIGNGSITNASVGHLAHGINTGMWASGLAPVGFPGEDARTRIDRVATAIGSDLQDSSPVEPTEYLAAQASGSALEVIRTAAQADGGLLCDAASTNNFWYIPWREIAKLQQNATPLALTVASGHVAAPPEPTIDDQFLCTEATVTRTSPSSASTGGTGSYVVDSTEAVSLTQSLAIHGVLRCQPAAESLVYRGGYTDVRLPSLEIDLRKNPSLIDRLCRTEVGYPVTITDPPVHLSSSTMYFYVLGWREYFDYWTWKVTLNLAPGAMFREIGQFGNSVTRRLEGEGVTVNGLHNTTTTSISAATANSTYMPLISTTAGDYPCDIVASTGEVMTVTAVSGASSPQTLTVTRSVNGVVKTLPSGTTLQLFNPFRLTR